MADNRTSVPPMDRFLNLIGGESNLPAKVMPTATPAEEEPPPRYHDDDPSNLQSADDLIASYRASGNNPPISQNQKKAEEKRKAVPAQSQVSPAFTPAHPPPIISDAELEYDRRCGEPAARGLRFSPFAAVTKFCYKYVDRQWQQLFATAFFDNSKIFDREWDMYYIFTGFYPTAKPITFVPEHQLQALIDEINAAFPTADIKLDDQLRNDGLSLDFDFDKEDFRPRFLGHSTARVQYNYWVDNLPGPAAVTITSEMEGDRSFQAFQRHMESAIEAGKNKNKAKRKAKQDAANEHKIQSKKQVLQAQRYMGLVAPSDDLIDVGNLSLSQLDPSKPAPYTSADEPIFIAIDCEAFEEGSRPVTEVGVATLDTRDLQGEAPGPNGENWQKLIRARHFRIIEHKHLVNRKYVEGCPDRFNFGKSEFVGKDAIASSLASCFREPFSKTTSNAPAEATDTDTNTEKRNIVLLGHDLMGDIQYCHQLGFSVLNRGNMLPTMDSSTMYKAYTQEVNPTALARVLYDFGLTAWDVHNAGNDAVYTIWAMLAVCVKDAAERGTEAQAERLKDALARKTEVAAEQAREKVEQEAEGWTVGGAGEERKGMGKQRPVFGPPRPPPESASGLYTMGGAPLDV